jgi:hypothetical protein
MKQAFGLDLGSKVITAMGLEDIYCGSTYPEVYAFVLVKFGLDISGEYDTGSVDENGPVMAPKCTQVTMAGE